MENQLRGRVLENLWERARRTRRRRRKERRERACADYQRTSFVEISTRFEVYKWVVEFKQGKREWGTHTHHTHVCAERVWGQGDVGKNGGMSRFVFLPVDSECDQLVKQRDPECGSGGGGGGREGGGPIPFTVRVCGRALSQSGMKEKNWAGYNIMNIMTNKRTFQSFVVAFLWPPTQLHSSTLSCWKAGEQFLYFQLKLKIISILRGGQRI